MLQRDIFVKKKKPDAKIGLYQIICFVCSAKQPGLHQSIRIHTSFNRFHNLLLHTCGSIVIKLLNSFDSKFARTDLLNEHRNQNVVITHTSIIYERKFILKVLIQRFLDSFLRLKDSFNLLAFLAVNVNNCFVYSSIAS